MVENVCYILTSTGDDAYAAMAHTSAASTRHLYPKAKILLLADEATERQLRSKKAGVLGVVDKVISVDTGLSEIKASSRFLKTSMRRLVEGDVVFLDVDVIPIRRFDGITTGDADVAACQDAMLVRRGEWYTWSLLFKHWRAKPNGTPDINQVYQQMGWHYPPRHYLNAGVIFFRDSEAAHRLCEEWHRRWRQTLALGRHQDQYAFNSALHDAKGLKVRVLPSKYNAMVRFSPWYAHGAKLFHFHSRGVGPSPGTVMHAIVEGCLATGRLDEEALARLRRTRYPWLETNSVMLQMATGHYGTAAALAGRRLMRGRGGKKSGIESDAGGNSP